MPGFDMKTLLARYVVLASLLIAPGAWASTARLVEDIVSTTTDGTSDVLVTGLAAAGKRVVLTAREPSSGHELWASDGTTYGTALIRDLYPGPDSPTSLRLLGSNDRFAFFHVGDYPGPVPTPQVGLWRTDGTEEGTLQLVSGLELEPPYFPREVSYVFQGSLLLVAGCLPDEGCSVWRSDGAPGATARLPVVHEAEEPLEVRELTAVGDITFFVVTTSSSSSLWRTDGTAPGTLLVRGMPRSASIRLLAATAGQLVFVADDDGDGSELWTSDGTTPGTRPITSFAAANPFERAFIESIGGIAYFEADDVVGGADLWTTDGTPAGTRRITEFGFAAPFGFNFGPRSLEQVGGNVIFPASDGLAVGWRLWVSKGTPQTTSVLAGCAGGCPPVAEDVELVRLGQRVLFYAFDPATWNTTLWSSNGSGAQTFPLLECSGCTNAPVVAGNRAFFVAADSRGSGVWVTDGTTAGTRRLAAVGPPSIQPLAGEFSAVQVGNRFFFVAPDLVHGPQLWASDGTAAGTSPLSVITDGGASSHPAALRSITGERVAFTAWDGRARTLWSTDGTADGTLHIAEPDPVYSSPFGLHQTARWAGRLYFLGDEGSIRQLWSTDGTAAGTRRETNFADRTVTGLAPAATGMTFAVVPMEHEGPPAALWFADGSGIRELVQLPSHMWGIDQLSSVDGELFFFSVDQVENDTQLWRSDGTPVGTRRLLGLLAYGARSTPLSPVRLGSAVYLCAFGHLVRTDGTAAGTTAAPLGVSNLTSLGGSLVYFAWAPDAPGGQALFVSDGSAAGTHRLADVTPPQYENEFDFAAAEMTASGSLLFFFGHDPEHGTELWKTDGTAAGTTLVEDVLPGPNSAFTRDVAGANRLEAAGGRVFFAATDGERGVELWESDGTPAGTHMVQDLAPGAMSSLPTELTVSGDELLFAANDGVTGRELWALPLGDGPGCVASATVLCLGGRYAVEARWRDFQGNTGAGRAAALTSDTGTFWFFDPANVEVVLKVLDGRNLNGHVWVFYGALSNVEYTLTVTDTSTGAARRYVNPSGRLGSVADTTAFGPRGATPSQLTFGPAASPLPATSTTSAATTPSACVASPTRMCLQDGRFAVEARWKTPGQTGSGKGVPLSGDTGYLWFFGPTNVELMVKVLDGRPLNGKFWVFYGALSDVEYTLMVTDTQTGAVREYRNPAGRLASVADTGAF
jgi:ELWxxDGT repeat protein